MTDNVYHKDQEKCGNNTRQVLLGINFSEVTTYGKYFLILNVV